MAIEVRETDKEFKDSPDAGRKECICSRCGQRIMAREMPLRVFTGKKRNTEYRYCEKCQSKDMGINYTPRTEEEDEDFWDDDPL